MNYLDNFAVAPGTVVKLANFDPAMTDPAVNRKDATDEIEQDQQKLRAQQELLYAGRSQSLLIVLQGLDASGKDGTINHVLSAMNPQGCRVVAFKQPSAEELAHDFLWRIHRATPALGEVVIFNRSHYEDVLAVRVHELVPEVVWSERFAQINAFEQELSKNKTHILKFFLHLSPDEQLKRFKDRLDDPTKQWKIQESDYKERQFWASYITAYEDVLSRCSTAAAPWFIIPADRNWFRNLTISRILVEFLEGLKMSLPAATVDLAHIRSEYHEAKKE